MQSNAFFVDFFDAMQCSKESSGKYTCQGWQPKYHSSSSDYTQRYPRFGQDETVSACALDPTSDKKPVMAGVELVGAIQNAIVGMSTVAAALLMTF